MTTELPWGDVHSKGDENGKMLDLFNIVSVLDKV